LKNNKIMSESIEEQIMRVLIEMVNDGEVEVTTKNGENYYKLKQNTNMQSRKEAALKAWETRREKENEKRIKAHKSAKKAWVTRRKMNNRGFDEDVKFKTRTKKSEFDQMIAERVAANKTKPASLAMEHNYFDITIQGFDFRKDFREALKKHFKSAVSKIVEHAVKPSGHDYIMKSLEKEISRALLEVASEWSFADKKDKKSLHTA